MRGFPKPRGRVLVLAALSAAALAYAAVRAVRIPIVHDEALTYFLYVAGRGVGQLDPRSTFEVNNHFLNSLLSAASRWLFGEGELALRLPNLLSLPLYLAATARLALRQRTAALTVAAFLLLNGSAFAMEFFSLSRGYGLGLAFLASGVALLVEAFEDAEAGTTRACFAFLCLGLASLANLSFLFPLAAAVAAGSAVEAWRRLARRLPTALRVTPSLLVPLALSLPFLLVLVPYATALSRSGRWIMGGSKGLWSDTAVSLLAVLRNLPPEEAPRAPLLEAVLAAVLLFLAAAVLVRPGRLSPLALVPTSLLALSVAGIEVAGRFLDARYPVDRAALPVQFLFLAAATGVAGDWIAERRSGWKPVSVAVLLSAALAATAFAAAAGTTHTLIWRYDADNSRMLDDLDRARRERGFTRPVRLGITWLMEPSLNYYRVRRRLSWLLPVTRLGLADRDPDYCYWTPKDDEAARALGLATLAAYPTSGNRLAARVRTFAPPDTPRIPH